MSRLWLRLRGMLGRERASRDSRTTPRTGAKAAVTSEAGSSLRPWYWPAGMGLAVIVLHLLLFPPVSRVELDFPEAGQIAQAEIRAPFTFNAPYLERDVEMQRLERVVVEPPALRSLKATAGQSLDPRMDLWFSALAEQIADTTITLADRAAFLSLQFPDVSDDELRRLLDTAQPDSLTERMQRAWQRIRRGGVVDVLPAGRYEKVVILTDQADILQDRSRITTQADLEDRLLLAMRAEGLTPRESVQAASVLKHFVTPNLVYDTEETRLRQDRARRDVETHREFIKGERIVDRGVRVTEQQARFLEELQDRIQAQGGGTIEGRWTRLITRVLLVVLALGLFGWLAWVHFDEQFRRLRFLLAMTAIVALFLLGASFALGHPALGPLAVPMALLSLLATVLYKQHVGYATTLLAVSLLAILPGVGAGSAFAWLALGMVTVLSVRRIQKRSQFYQTIMLLTGLSLVLIFLLSLAGADTAVSWRTQYLVGIFASVLTVAFGLFLLPVVEPLVGVCSDLTLLELSDLNHPLLQRMAPGSPGARTTTVRSSGSSPSTPLAPSTPTPC